MSRPPLVSRLHRPALLAFLLVAPAAVRAQAPRYRVPADTQRYTRDNPFRMYWVRGADTIGTPRRELGVEARAWREAGGSPEVVVRALGLDVGRRTSTDTFRLSADGRVRAINGRRPGSNGRLDLLLQLPGRALARGTTWTDTVHADSLGAAGREWYRVVRRYRVTRLVDTLGARGVADVAAEGDIDFRFAWVTDSAAGRTAWIDVRGPVTERYLFDVAGGRLLHRHWDMDLRGRGVPPEGGDTVPAGLFSKETLHLDDSPRVRFLLAPVPGADSAYWLDANTGAAMLLHTVRRTPGSVASSLTRNDGMVGVAESRREGGRLAWYHATWADSTPATREYRVAVRGDSLVAARPGAPDTAMAIPRGAWGVADFGMDEHLVEALLGLPRGETPHEWAVFRPVAGTWERGTAVVQERGGAVVAIVRTGDDASTVKVLVATPDGDLLLGEEGVPPRTRRVASDAPRLARLRELLAQLRSP